MSEPSAQTGEARIRRALMISLAVFGVAALAIVAMVLLRQERQAPATEDRDATPPRAPATTAVAIPAMPFTDITAAAGIDFVHQTGAYGERLLPETMGGGVAFFDYDNDGDQDLLLVNSTTWPWAETEATEATSKLYRNRGDGTFEDVSAQTGMDLRLYGMGPAIGDIDGDGFQDVFIAAVGGNRLLRNVGGERFEDATAATGLAGADDAWSTSAAFFDMDGDGDLDLFVCNYVRWSLDIDREVDFRLTGIGRAYGSPTNFPGTDSYLYRNDGGRFVDVSAEAGILVANPATGVPVGKGLAVRPLDVNDDGRPDLVVANDTVQNFLFVNEGGGRFREAGVELGIAFSAAGSATGAMGLDAARYANDAKLGIAVGNFANEMSSFYVARAGESVFSDDATVSGIGAPSRRALTFGLVFMDADLDGRLDLLVANGHIEPEIGRVQESQEYAQPAQIFWNCGAECPRRFVLAKDIGDLAAPRIGRGLAYADIDADGDLDVALTQAGGSVALLRNDQATGHNWARFVLAAASGTAVGARVELATGGIIQTRVAMPARSYLSQVELPVSFGLGDARSIDSVAVHWPGGSAETWRDLAVNRVHTLRQGDATAAL